VERGRTWLGRTAAAGLAAALLAMPAASAAWTAPASARAPSPASRLLVAIAVGPAAALPASLPESLRLADPAATAIVVDRDGAPVASGPFLVTPGADGLAISAAAGPSLLMPLTVPPGPSPSPGFDPASPSPDASLPPADGVLVVEVLGDASGIAAHRIGDLAPSPDELRLPVWRLPGPGQDAVMLEHGWWILGPGPHPAPAGRTPPPARARQVARRILRDHVQLAERVIDLSLGDVTGDGHPDLAVSFRRPFRTNFLNAHDPTAPWKDAAGLSAHLGILRPADLSPIWVAGTLLKPVARLAACDGALAVTLDTLDDERIVAGSAWDWEGFGFLPLAELSGPGIPVCLDIDRDGRTDPAIVERS
jgi:hypothetical protein